MSYRIPTPMEKLAETLSVNGLAAPVEEKGTTPELPLTPPETMLEQDKERTAEDDIPAEAPPTPPASEGVHPFTISPEEGLPSVPLERLLVLLQKMLAQKYAAIVFYAHHADVIRAHYRDAIYDHFEEHGKEERQGAYDIAMKIVALGGTPDIKVDKIPDATTMGQVFTTIIQAEKALIQSARDVLAVCGEYVGLRLMVEENLLKDQRHLDDARRMLVNLE